MTTERTELEWVYEPSDLFEAEYRSADSLYDLLVRDGRAVATLKVPQNPVNERLVKRIGEDVEAILQVRQLRKHRPYTLSAPRIHQHGARGGTVITINVGDEVISEGQADVLIRDQAGNIVGDSKATRIADDTAMIDSLAPKVARSPLLRGMLSSYSRSIDDPATELVRLYEVRDALQAHYHGEQHARAALAISESEWKRLGILANVEPIEQGRHRGQHVAGRRDATASELEEARSIVQRWIAAVANVV